MGVKKLSRQKENQILELFFNSDDNNSVTISKIVGEKPDYITSFLDMFFKSGERYQKSEFKIFNSKMNYE